MNQASPDSEPGICSLLCIAQNADTPQFIFVNFSRMTPEIFVALLLTPDIFFGNDPLDNLGHLYPYSILCIYSCSIVKTVFKDTWKRHVIIRNKSQEMYKDTFRIISFGRKLKSLFL